MKSGFLGTAIRVLVSFAAIVLIVFSLRHDLLDSIQILRTEVIWPLFFLAIVTYSTAIVVQAIRLQYVFRVQAIFLKFGEVLYLNLVGLFFNLFLPSAVGGDIAKAYYAYKHSGKKIGATTSVILDRLMGFVALIVMALAALLIFGQEIQEPRIKITIFIFMGIMLLSMLFFSSKRFARLFKFFVQCIPSQKLKERLSEIYHAIYHYKKHQKILLLSVFVSFLSQIIFILANYLVAVSLGIGIAFPLFFILIPISSIVSMAPSIGGLGVREAGLIYLFKRYIPNERALAYSLLLDILVYGISLAAGLVYLVRGGLKAKEVIHEMEEEIQ